MASSPPERKLAEGIFITDFRKPAAAAAPDDELASLRSYKNQHPSIIQHEINRIYNSLSHLLRSNKELEDALREAHDEDFRIALQENVLIVEKQRRQITFLQSLISAHAHVPTPTAPSVPTTTDEEGVYL